ncbi:MAG: hypothetical protein M1353_05410 [Nitrospirae bacterium]|nr:hypothetical protein [Nitrospirota bacterium]
MGTATEKLYTATGGKARTYTCPFDDIETDICTASCSSMPIDERMRMKYCANEDYDDCPVFLVKKLTRR